MTEKKEKNSPLYKFQQHWRKKCAGGIEFSSISKYVTYKLGEMFKTVFFPSENPLKGFEYNQLPQEYY